ncbi:MAG: hypothetical protein ABJN69_09660 [Hellea sp.]
MSENPPKRRVLVLNKNRLDIGGREEKALTAKESAKRLGISEAQYTQHQNRISANSHPKAGTKLYCPNCKEERYCKAISPARLGRKSAQRVCNPKHPDIKWFRRGRRCLTCFQEFLTGELDEKLIEELAMLRAAWLASIQSKASNISRSARNRFRKETVSLEDAQDFIRACAKWDHPTAGYPVDAPKHAKRVKTGFKGWQIEFGANQFLPGYAIEQSGEVIDRIFKSIADGELYFREDLERAVEKVVCRSVLNTNYDLITYPDDGEYLTFGTQKIELRDAVRFIMQYYKSDGVLLSKYRTN